MHAWKTKLEGAAMITNRQHEWAFGSEYALNEGNRVMCEVINDINACIVTLGGNDG